MITVRANGVDLRVSRYGASEPDETRPVIVFVHGLTVDHAGLGFTLGMPFSTSAEVILYDLRGHGRSQMVPSGYQVIDHVADLIGLLDELDVGEPVHLVAGSYGGAVAMVAAARHPGRVASVSLIEGLIPCPGWNDLVAGTLQRAAEKLHHDYTAEEAREVLGITSLRKAGGILRRTRRLLLETTLIADVRAEVPLDPGEHTRITCPVLGLYGDKSDLYPVAEVLQSWLSHAEIHTVPGVDHVQIFWRTRMLKSVIGDFIGLTAAGTPGSPAIRCDRVP